MIWGFNLNLGLSMSIIYWRCVSCSVISFLLIFVDIRTGMCYSVIPLNLLLMKEGNWKIFFLFFPPRCNTGRFLHGLPDFAWWSPACGVFSCHTCIWRKGISPKPLPAGTAEEKHPLPQRSQTLCPGNCRAGRRTSSELLSSQRWGWSVMWMLKVLLTGGEGGVCVQVKIGKVASFVPWCEPEYVLMFDCKCKYRYLETHWAASAPTRVAGNAHGLSINPGLDKLKRFWWTFWGQANYN